ncbi:MAG: DUF2723 domain-containing protein [Chloroflexota bacterium]|nr:DUF2723 domain-containing protein [Chloroflexota bacterium]
MVSGPQPQRISPHRLSPGRLSASRLTSRSIRSRAADLLGVAWPALGAAFISLAIYVPTLMPDIGFWDTAEFQAIGPVLGIAHPTGYPSYTLLAWLASVLLQPLGTEAFRANFLNALLMAFAAGLLALAVTLLTRRRAVALAAGLLLGLAPTVWGNAVRADAHALHLALVASLMVVLLVWADRQRRGDARAGRWLVASAVIYGVALGNHALTLLLAPGIAAYLLLVEPRLLWRWRLVLGCVAALVLTTVALYLYLPIRSAMDPLLDYADPQAWVHLGAEGNVIGGFRYLVLGEQFRGTFSPLPSLIDGVSIIWRQIWLELGPIAVLSLGGVAVAALRWPRELVLLALWFVVTWVFALGYQNASIERYYLVPLLVAVVFAAMLAAFTLEMVERFAERRREDCPVERRLPRGVAIRAALLRWMLPGLAAFVLMANALVSFPATYERVDASGDRAARIWLDATFQALAPDAVIVSWWSYSTPMWYGQYVEGRRPDVLVMDDRTILDAGLGDVHGAIARYLPERPVYLIRLPRDIEAIASRYRLVPVQGLQGRDVWRVLPAEVGYDRVVSSHRGTVSARPVQS